MPITRHPARSLPVLAPLLALALALTLALTLAPAALAANATQADTDLGIDLRAGASGAGPAKFDQGKGEMAWYEYSLRARYKPWRFLSVTASFSETRFSWDDVGELRFGNGRDDPFTALRRASLAVDGQWAVAKDWGMFAGVTGSTAFEEQLEGSLGGALRLGASWSFAEDWRLEMGGAAFVNAVRWRVFPLLNLHYDGRENGQGLFGSLGLPVTEIGYGFNDIAALRASLAADTKFYRLRDQSPVAQKGYVETVDLVAGLYLDLEPVDDLLVTLGPTFNFQRDLRLFDKNGNHIRTLDLENTFGGALSLRYKF